MRAPAALLLALSAAGAAQARDAPICTDRPAKANAVCTVPAGRAQLEASGMSWSLTDLGGVRTELLTIGAFVAKLGLDERADLQIGFTPYAELRSPGRASGIGDLVLRYKRRLTGADAPVQVAMIPFVKLPTAARGLGNGRVEGGLAVPVSFALLGRATITLGPELDILADAGGHGRHIALVNLVNLSAPIGPRLTIAGELWTNLNFDPGGTVEQASFDAAIAYAASRNLQLDLGANIGLTRDTPDFEGSVGVSVRF